MIQRIRGQSTQSSQSTSKNRAQTQESQVPKNTQDRQRTALREQYRRLIDLTQDQKNELIEGTAELQESLQLANQLFQTVKQPREAALDAEFMNIASAIGQERVRKIVVGSKNWEPKDFLDKLKKKLQVGDEPDDLNWNRFDDLVQSLYRRTPTSQFLLGSLGRTPTEKKIRKAPAIREKAAEQLVIEATSEHEPDPDSLDRETSMRVQKVHECLKQLPEDKPMEFERFVVNPQSFTQSIENIFHFSFLLKDGHASLDSQSNQTQINLSDPPDPEDFQTGKAKKNQAILRFDYSTWEALSKKIGSSQSFIPHRAPSRLLDPTDSRISKRIASESNSSSKKLKSETQKKSSKKSNNIEE